MKLINLDIFFDLRKVECQQEKLDVLLFQRTWSHAMESEQHFCARAGMCHLLMVLVDSPALCMEKVFISDSRCS